jgi:hypothetical protein
MPQVTLHIFDRAMFLDVRGGCTAKCLLCEIEDADALRDPIFSKLFDSYFALPARDKVPQGLVSR